MAETEAPEGYRIADPITFRVTADNTIEIQDADDDWVLSAESRIHMEDTPIINIDISKVWEDSNDKHNARPDSIRIELYADGNPTDEFLVLNADNEWTGTFADLDVNVDGEAVEYTVNEVSVDGYKTVITGDATNGYVITNRYITKDIPKTGENLNILVYSSLAVLSMIVVVYIYYARKKEQS